MREAATLNGEFLYWSPELRDAKVRKLARVANRFQLKYIYYVMDLEAFERHAVGRGKPFNDPYFWGFYAIVFAAGFDLLSQKHTDRFEIIFDEQTTIGGWAKALYPMTRALLWPPEVRAILPVEPVFRNDKDFLPLQAADLFAWSVRVGTVQDPHPFGWLAEENERNSSLGFLLSTLVTDTSRDDGQTAPP